MMADRCKLCNRELTNPESQRIGIGPICLKRVINYLPQVKEEMLREKAGNSTDKAPVIDGQISIFDKEG